MPKLVPNSRDSQFSVSNNRSRSNFSPICRSSHIRRNSTCLNMSTVCRGAMTQDSWICRVFSICREYIGNNLAKLACRWFAYFWICHEYAGIFWICCEYAGVSLYYSVVCRICREYVGVSLYYSAACSWIYCQYTGIFSNAANISGKYYWIII